MVSRTLSIASLKPCSYESPQALRLDISRALMYVHRARTEGFQCLLYHATTCSVVSDAIRPASKVGATFDCDMYDPTSASGC